MLIYSCQQLATPDLLQVEVFQNKRKAVLYSIDLRACNLIY